MTNRPIHELIFKLSYDLGTCFAGHPEIADIDIPPIEMRTMRYIWGNRNATSQGVAQLLKRDKAQVSRVIKHLMTIGMVERRPNPEDGRSKLLELTTKGDEIFNRIEKIEQPIRQKLLLDVEGHDLEVFERVCANISKNISNMQVDKKKPADK